LKSKPETEAASASRREIHEQPIPNDGKHYPYSHIGRSNPKTWQVKHKGTKLPNRKSLTPFSLAQCQLPGYYRFIETGI
jgi:hypothetical protein